MVKQVVKAGRQVLDKNAINRKLTLQQEQVRALVHKYVDASLLDLPDVPKIVPLFDLMYVEND